MIATGRMGQARVARLTPTVPPPASAGVTCGTAASTAAAGVGSSPPSATGSAAATAPATSTSAAVPAAGASPAPPSAPPAGLAFALAPSELALSDGAPGVGSAVDAGSAVGAGASACGVALAACPCSVSAWAAASTLGSAASVGRFREAASVAIESDDRPVRGAGGKGVKGDLRVTSSDRRACVRTVALCYETPLLHYASRHLFSNSRGRVRFMVQGVGVWVQAVTVRLRQVRVRFASGSRRKESIRQRTEGRELAEVWRVGGGGRHAR